MNPLLLDIDEVAHALGVSRRTAYELRLRAGFPKPIVLGSGRCVRYRAADVAAFVKRLVGARAPREEPDQLRLGKARSRGALGGASGGIQARPVAKAQPARKTGEKSSVELSGGNSGGPRRKAR